ncbi:MAG: DUF3990 domain-containing protein [Lachnospiraceae bacterium]|nr:DUF3990 domain-containing protein [Lachnospiraceae bacterium]
MNTIIRLIRQEMGKSQEELAQMLGSSFTSVNRWENGRAVPGKMAQKQLYELSKEKGISVEKMIMQKIHEAVSDAHVDPSRITLYHGSKAGIQGIIAPISREKCDFGPGFYMGTDPYQPLTLISDFEESKFYIVSLSLEGLNTLSVRPDLEWAMLVAFYRGKMERIRGTKLYETYAQRAQGVDIVIGSIANDRMFYVLDNFFLGNITDKALVMSLSALQLGQQYVALTQKACDAVQIEKEIPLSYLERQYMKDISEANRAKGIELANDICRNYRREGLFFDELLDMN